MLQLLQFETEPYHPDIIVSNEDKALANLQHIISADTKNGYREYRLRCVAMQEDSTGEIIDIRKDKCVDYYDPTDWFIARYCPSDDTYTQDKVTRVLSIEQHDSDDVITLELPALVSHTGPRMLTFSVTKDYKPNGSYAKISHANYYGRGTGAKPEHTIDSYYTNTLLNTPHKKLDDKLAPVITLDEWRRLRQRPIGEVSLIAAKSLVN